MRALRQRLVVLAVVALVAGVGSFALGIWTSVNQTFDTIGSGSSSIGTDLTGSSDVPTFQGPSTWSVIAETTLTVRGVTLVAIGGVAVAGVIATLVVEHARTPVTAPAGEDPTPPQWPQEVVGNGS